MNFRKLIVWLLGLSLVFVGLYFVAEWQMKKAIVSFLERKVPDHIQYSYDQLNLNLLRGNIEFGNATVNSMGRQTSSCEIRIHTSDIIVKGFSYKRFFSDNEVHAKEIRLSRPNLYFKTCPKDTTNISKANKPINLLKPISVDNIVLETGQVEIWDSQGGDRLLKVDTIDFSMKYVGTDSMQIKQYVPFKFEDYSLSFNKISGPSGDFEEFFVESYHMDNHSIKVLDFKFNTKYSRKELSKKIQYERDHITLRVPEIQIERHDLSVIDEVLHLEFDTIAVREPYFDIYRDKSLLENHTRRPLYAELIRELPIKLQITDITIADGLLKYEENAPNNDRPGILTFEDLNVGIKNFSNLEEEGGDVEIKIKSKFMDSGGLELDWKFNVFDPKESFIISGGLSNLKTTTLNDFLIPNARLRSEGTIDQMYFTISGGEYTAQGDIKMNYEDFRIQLLNKERDHVKKIISFIGNLFINDGSRADENGYRYGTIEVERNRNKSFFNYLWVGLEDGLIDVITGSGKKK